MPEVLKLFDAYTIRARIVPALIAGLPSLTLPLAVVPWNHLGLSNAVVVTMSFVLLYAFADLARSRGHSVERRLKTQQTPRLWFRKDKTIPELSKAIYRRFIAEQLSHPAPSERDESERPDEADDFYLSAGNWLRDQTRDHQRFNILHDELITYGFRRNLLGLKTISLTMNVAVFLLIASAHFVQPQYLLSLPAFEEMYYILTVVTLLHSAYMIFAVREDEVINASKSYGRQLILSCEVLMKTNANDRS